MAGKKQILIRAALLAFLGIQGLILGLLCQSRFAPQPQATQSDKPVLPVPDAFGTVAVYEPLQHRQIAENLIQSDHHSQAIPHLLNAAPQHIEDADDELLFRIALCFEASGDIERATRYYSQLMNRPARVLLVAACRNGLARCRGLQGNLAGARQLLWKSYLLSGKTESFPDINEEALLILARSFASQGDHHAKQLVNRTALIQGFHPKLDVARQLKLATATHAEPEQTKSNTAENVTTASDSPELAVGVPFENNIKIDQIMQAGDGPENRFASFQAQQVDLDMLMQWTMTKLGVEIEITDKARNLADNQLVSVDMDHISLPTALDVQTLPFGLGWRIRNNLITVFALKETSPEIEVLIQQNAAIRILNRVLMLAPDHPHAGYLRFQLASLQFQLGNAAQSIAIHNDLLTGPIDSRLRRAVNFNLGQLQAIYSNPKVAIESFGKVVDSNEGGEIKTVAYLRSGQIQLQLGQQDQAITSFLRAARSSDLRYYRQIAKLGIASTYLLNNQPDLAAKALAESHSLFSGSQFVSAINFLVAFSQFESSTGQKSLDDRGRLLSALANLYWPSEPGSYGEFLKAEAWIRLGFADEAIETLQVLARHSDSDWLRQRSMEQLSELLLSEGRLDEARTVLLEVIQSMQPSVSAGLRIRLASLEFTAGNHRECLRLCTAILSDPASQAIHSDALKLMGSIYQVRGDHYTAALCLSGLLPDTSSPAESK